MDDMASLAIDLDTPAQPTKLELVEQETTFTLDPAYAYRVTNRIMQGLNDHYFRSRFVGFDEPIRGKHAGAPVIYASNHSGMAFPWDGMSLVAGMFERSGYQLKDAMRPR